MVEDSSKVAFVLTLFMLQLLEQLQSLLTYFAGHAQGCTALHHAAANDLKEAVRMLLSHGADVDAKDATVGSSFPHWCYVPCVRACVRACVCVSDVVHQACQYALCLLLRCDTALTCVCENACMALVSAWCC